MLQKYVVQLVKKHEEIYNLENGNQLILAKN